MLIRDVAKLSGVSRSTVSRVINDDPNVKESTRAHVLKVVRKTKYRPNSVARGLASGRTKIIGLVLPTAQYSLFTDPYYPGLIQGITTVCNASGYLTMLWLTNPKQERSNFHHLVLDGLLDGLIMASYLIDDPILKELTKSKIQFVLIGRPSVRPNLFYIDSDNVNGAREAVKHLLQLGRTRIATITGPNNMIAGIDRRRGYENALVEMGIRPDPELIVEGDFTERGGYDAMIRLIPHNPDAVFVASDAMALGAFRALNEAGRRIPEDVAVVGFDDIPSSTQVNPPLTTVRQNIFQLGQLAAETLMKILSDGKTPPHGLVLPTELVVRASSGVRVKSVA